ncbi:MAG: hypothetical protein U1F11_13940 [Steroidobacteraceae bacterium]
MSKAVEVAGHSVTVVLGAHANELCTAAGDFSPPSTSTAMGDGLLIRAASRACRAPSMARRCCSRTSPRSASRTCGGRRWRRQPEYIVAARYGSTVGVPAIFPRCACASCRSCADRGAQSLLRRHADRLVRVPMPAAAADIDTPEDLLSIETATPDRA